jgi:hypothetical protein
LFSSLKQALSREDFNEEYREAIGQELSAVFSTAKNLSTFLHSSKKVTISSSFYEDFKLDSSIF